MKRRWILLLNFALVMILIIFSFQLIKLTNIEENCGSWSVIPFCATNVKPALRSNSFRIGQSRSPVTIIYMIPSSRSCHGCAVMNKYCGLEIGFCKGRSVSRSLGQRLHRKDNVGAGWNDRRASSSRSYDGHPPVVRSVGLAAATTAAATAAADDHDDDEDKRAANHSSLLQIRHVMPPGKDTWIKTRL